MVCAIAAAMVLAFVAVGITVALPGTSGSANGGASLTKTDFDLVFASVNARSQVEEVPKVTTRIAFDQVFASIAKAQLDNPPNREKLRNAGWKRVLQKS